MQNLGFAMSIIPLIKEINSKEASREILIRHLQLFNTNPYLSASVIGSVVKLEEEKLAFGDEALDIAAIKKSLMASYAAIGDIFFWGALRPFAVIFAIFLIYIGIGMAPLAFLFIYTPVHLWVRVKGFVEGYRKGKAGFEFIRSLNLPSIAMKIRWLALVLLAFLTMGVSCANTYWYYMQVNMTVVLAISLVVVMLSLFLIRKGVSQISIVYGTFLLLMIFMSGKDLLR
jgi:PTS system mannose-specific IID component